MWPSPAAQEPGWQHISVVDRDGNIPEHWNQRFYDAATGRVVQKGLTQAAQLWPTSQAHDAQGPKTPEQIAAMRHRTAAGVRNLNEVAPLWRTPTSGHPQKGGAQDPAKRLVGGHTLDLQDQVLLWQTPSAADGNGGHLTRSEARSRELLLPGQAKVVTEAMWPTPCAQMGGGRHRGKADTLHSAAKGWNTPRSRDYKGGGKDTLSTDAERFPSFPPAPPTAADGPPSSESAPTSPRRLNPAFAEWLMGLPPGWTDPLTSIEASAFARWAMQSSPPRQHGRSSPLPLSLGGGGDESETDGAA